MSSHTEQFFDLYAKMIDDLNAEGLAELHMLPTVIVRENNKRIYTKLDELIEARNNFLTALKALFAVKAVPQVKQAMQLSESIIFANVRWQFLDDQENVSLSFYCSYTLQQISDSEMKIIVAVLDDEDKVITNLLDSKPD